MENKYNNEESSFSRAKKRVEEIKGFYGNLISYIAVNIGLVVINLMTSPEYLWFFWPLIGWGIGVLFHGIRVFNYMPFLGKEWEERKLKEFMDEEQNKTNKWQ